MKRHVTCFVEKAGFEPMTLGTKAERYDHCATRQVVVLIMQCDRFQRKSLLGLSHPNASITDQTSKMMWTIVNLMVIIVLDQPILYPFHFMHALLLLHMHTHACPAGHLSVLPLCIVQGFESASSHTSGIPKKVKIVECTRYIQSIWTSGSYDWSLVYTWYIPVIWNTQVYPSHISGIFQSYDFQPNWYIPGIFLVYTFRVFTC